MKYYKELSENIVAHLTANYIPSPRIENDGLITNDIIQELKNLPGIRISRLQDIFGSSGSKRWAVEIKCHHCNYIHSIQYLSKVRMVEYIQGKFKKACRQCSVKTREVLNER